MKKVLLLLPLMVFAFNLKAQIRVISVNPVTQDLTIRNYGNSDVDISDYRLCSNITYTVDLDTDANVTIVSGDLVLSQDEEVTVNWATMVGLDPSGRDLGLYLPGVGGFGDAANMVDYMQYLGSFPFPDGRENVAETAGLWVAGTFVTGDAPYTYNGNGNDLGVDFWEGVTPVCNISVITAGTQTACDPGTNTYTQEVTVTYENAPSTGTLEVNGQSFAITSSPQTVTLVDLTADNTAVDATASFSDEGGCSLTVTSLFTAPADCTPQPCAITALSAGTQTACDPGTNTYTQQVTVTYENAPASGTLEVNGQSFAIASSPQTVTLVDLTADGAAVDVTASFSDDAACTFTEAALFTAPANCTPNPCAITALSAGTQTACDPGTNTYTQQVTVTYENAPSSGTLEVNGQSFAIASSPQTVTLVDLTADEAAVDVTASFSDDAACTFTEAALFTAPADCTPQPCAITALSAGTQTACDPGTNTYTQEVTVTYENVPASGTLEVNGQSFAIASSPQTVTLVDLTADGAAVDVTASFSDDAACTFTEAALFTAPANCTPNPCAITALSAGTQTACDPGTNTYTQEVTVTYENAPASGTLEVNGQSFAIASSPQTVTLVDLTADGAVVDVTASFSDDAACTFTEAALFTAPANCTPNPCAITALSAGTQTACDPGTNTYTQEVTVTYENAPASGTLEVNGQSFAIASSPQTVTLVDLTADEAVVDVNASFSDDAACTFTEAALFTAPADCTPVGNEPPLAVDDEANTTVNNPVVIVVLNNDSDSDGTLDISSVLVVSLPQNGNTLVNGDGTITYSPDLDFTGSDSFTYTVEDDDGSTSNEAMVTVMVDTITGTGCTEPENLRVTSIKYTGVVLAWEEVEDAKFYRIRIQSKDHDQPKIIKSLHPKIQVRDLKPGRTYRWGVQAVCSKTEASETVTGPSFTLFGSDKGVKISVVNQNVSIKIDRRFVKKIRIGLFDSKGHLLRKIETHRPIREQYLLDIPPKYFGQLLIVKVKTNIGGCSKKLQIRR